ncbi:MAG: DUF4124 domain-containing protein [Gammaproteobacteria bacterium]
MLNFILRIFVSSILLMLSFSVLSNEIYKSIDEDGNVTFSSIAPLNAKIVKTVNVKKLLKRISVINGASEQHEKVKLITERLKDSRIERNKKRQEKTKNYKDEISLIKNQRLEGLKQLQDKNSSLESRKTESQKLKESVRKMLEPQE